MKTKKKSRFLTFCFSLLPGAGEMYMGFMRMGVSLMLLFFFAIFVPSMMRLDALTAFAVIIWFYGFFHANHLASLQPEEFEQVEDTYLFGVDALANGKDFVKKYQKWVAAALIIAGIFLLWDTITDIAYSLLPAFIYEAMCIVGNYAPRILVAVIIIIAGVKMIQGRKEQLAKLEEPEENPESKKEE